jgi:hypothetical protein
MMPQPWGSLRLSRATKAPAHISGMTAHISGMTAHIKRNRCPHQMESHIMPSEEQGNEMTKRQDTK